MKNRQNTENLKTTMRVYRCESRVTKAIYHIIHFDGSPEILLQCLLIYGITILFFPGEAGVQRLVDNILAIISSNKTTISKSLELIGTTPSKTKLYRIFELAADCKFEKLRDFIAKEIGLEIIIESLVWIKSYDFFGSEGYFVNYLRTKDIRNDKYFTNFKCHQCTNTFDTMSKISSIGNVVRNSARGYSGNAMPIMVSPDIGNATCNGTPPVANN